MQLYFGDPHQKLESSPNTKMSE